LSYLLLALAIPLLFLARQPAALWAFALTFGFAMGADYLLIPLVTAECFGLASLGKLLSLIIMADSLGQFFGPVLAGRIFEATHSYDLAWSIITAAGILGAAAIYAVRTPRTVRVASPNPVHLSCTFPIRPPYPHHLQNVGPPPPCGPPSPERRGFFEF